MVAELGLLFDFGLVLVAGTVFGFLARELKQPLLVGYIIAGLIIGPLGFQLISDSNAILSLAELGVAFLLFAVGMEIDFSKLAQYKKPILIGGFLQVAITSVIVSLALRFFALPFLESVYVGLIVAFSSSVIAVKLLTDSRQLNSLEGKLIIGYALVQDLLAVVLMPLLAHPESVFSPGALVMLLASFVVLVLTGYILGKFVFPRVTTEAAKSQEVFFLTMVSSCFLFIFLSKSLGFPLAVGAFIGGLALGRIPFNLEAQNSVHYLRDLFGTVFFVALGLQLKTLVLGPLF
ncbi:MAG: cation:proton antiporter, partial [Candidatus Diapherotrites archaeon]|nr:cation:proton antiporter [Candidatus Diapherotrites archaeon]